MMAWTIAGLLIQKPCLSTSCLLGTGTVTVTGALRSTNIQVSGAEVAESACQPDS